jgi:hypothetical protein
MSTNHFAMFNDGVDVGSEPEEHAHDFRGRFATALDARQHMRAGKSTITIKSLKTEARFTYRLTLSDDGACIFVSVLNGPDNYANYKYIGRISRDIFWAGRKTPRPDDIAKDAPSVVAFAWTWKQLAQGHLPGSVEVWHEGRCGRCGRKLTVPESVAAGFGPECAGKIESLH